MQPLQLLHHFGLLLPIDVAQRVMVRLSIQTKPIEIRGAASPHIRFQLHTSIIAQLHLFVKPNLCAQFPLAIQLDRPGTAFGVRWVSSERTNKLAALPQATLSSEQKALLQRSGASGQARFDCTPLPLLIWGYAPHTRALAGSQAP